MTPLAFRLAKQLVEPVRKRVDPWKSNPKQLSTLLEDIHCFECTAAFPMVTELCSTLKHQPEDTSDAYYAQLSFLPAPRTWIEWTMYGCRMAIHLCEMQKGKASAILVFEEGAGPLGFISLESGDVEFPGGTFGIPTRLKEPLMHFAGGSSNGLALQLLALAHNFLVIINTPRIIGREQFMPHRDLERRFIRTFGAGKFPLHAWTEIKLSINKPPEIDDGEPHEAHLTGRRALHFCRAHLRLRCGQLEFVTSHWRGDPAIGIKRSRYALTAA